MKFMTISSFSLSFGVVAAFPHFHVSSAGYSSPANNAPNFTLPMSNPKYSVPNTNPQLTFEYLLDRRPAGVSGTVIPELAHECGVNHALQIETKFAHGHMGAGERAPEDCGERLCILQGPTGMIRMHVGYFRHDDMITWETLADIWMGIAEGLLTPPYERIWETYVLVTSGDDDDPITWFSQFGHEPTGQGWAGALENSTAVNSAVSLT